MRARAIPLVLFLLALTERARADTPPDGSTEAAESLASSDSNAGEEAPLPSTGERALAGATAVVPGVIAHGTGHFVAGETATGTKLLIAEGVGVGLLFGGLTAVVATGASRYFVGPSAAVMVAGGGLFTTSFVADLYGSVSPDPGAAGNRSRPPPWIETELGYRYVADPIFEYQDFLVESVSMRSDALRLTPSAWFSVAGDNALYRLEGAYRFLGPNPSPSARPVLNDFVDLALGLAHHRYVPEHFTRSTMEAALESRYDLGHVGRTLRGSFVEGSLGYAFGRIDYDIQGVAVPPEFDDLLLARFAFGAVLRGAAKPGSELFGYYDHRHDGFAGGLLLAGIPSGIGGHFGAEARWFFSENVGVSAHFEVGSAYVTGLSLLFRQAAAGPLGDTMGKD
ncbi:MAG TPA: hypothetical protein VF103_12710 [Polyangiaceae bacterium]